MGRWHGRSWVPAAAAVAIVFAAAPASGGPTASGAARAGRVTLKLTGCPALPRAAGCVYRRRPRTIYLRPGLRHPRAVLLHELGQL